MTAMTLSEFPLDEMSSAQQEEFLRACALEAFGDSVDIQPLDEPGQIQITVPADKIKAQYRGTRTYQLELIDIPTSGINIVTETKSYEPRRHEGCGSAVSLLKSAAEDAWANMSDTYKPTTEPMESSQASSESEGTASYDSEPVSDKHATFDPETRELTIQISADHLALTSVALTYVETFSESDGTYTDLGEAVRDYLEEMIDEVRPDSTGEPREEKFRSFCPMLSSDAGDLADKTIEELDDRYREVQRQREDLKDRAFSEEISDEEAIQIRKNVQELGKQLDRIGRWHRCAMLLRATARYSPYAHIIL